MKICVIGTGTMAKGIVKAFAAQMPVVMKSRTQASLDKAIEMAQKMIKNAPLAIKYAKECINESYDLIAEDAIELENTNFGKCFATEDQKEGMAAFLEKREATFKGK